MAAKKKALKIKLGINRGKIVTITKKKAKDGFLIVKLEDGKEVEIHNTLIE